jgi:iron(III) transport system ATP-binding protein
MLTLRNLTKRYGPTAVVDALDLEIRDGEFFTLLGPSGCGKTTTLRCIAGLERPDGGSVHLGERCLADPTRGLFVQPERRNMGMVFQSYALWPHMTVFENVAYPLRLRRLGRAEIRRKVDEVLQLVGLEGYADRPAPMLSGGQQQRVALARALVFSPQVLLLDEPLSNLDALLRDEMRQQLRGLSDRIGVTTIFVTHDQVEALSLSDRIAIMRSGRVEQVGAPMEVYSAPSTPFAQAFLGKTFGILATVVDVRQNGLDVIPAGAHQAEVRLAVPAPIVGAHRPARRETRARGRPAGEAHGPSRKGEGMGLASGRGHQSRHRPGAVCPVHGRAS